MSDSQVKIKNRQYLRDGRRYWTGGLFDAFLIFENGYSFLSIHELTEAFECFSSDLTFLEKWTFEEIICSTLFFCQRTNHFILVIGVLFVVIY